MPWRVDNSPVTQKEKNQDKKFTSIHHAIIAKGRHWAARGLSFLGRVHVAKQVLAASLWYHASFQRSSERLLKQLSQQLRKFVASAQQASHSDDAEALAQDCSHGSGHLPSSFPMASSPREAQAKRTCAKTKP